MEIRDVYKYIVRDLTLVAWVLNYVKWVKFIINHAEYYNLLTTVPKNKLQGLVMLCLDSSSLTMALHCTIVLKLSLRSSRDWSI